MEPADGDSIRMVPLSDDLAPPNGTRMLILGGVAMGVGLAGQMVGYGWMHRTCGSIVREELDDASFGIAVSCGVGFAGGGATLFISGIPQLMGMPWVIAGVVQRGRHRAFEDARRGRGERRGRRIGFIAGGSAMLAAGVALWVVAPVAAFQRCDEDPSITCSLDATTWGWNLGLGLVTAGSGMLGNGITYARTRRRYERAFQSRLTPSVSLRHAGVAWRGRF